ncbi:MAG: invasion associated locus B family protein [Pseudomonadota bacterium]|nr:invasion associated locus B family protein [Pseudomonadota bacterium]
MHSKLPIAALALMAAASVMSPVLAQEKGQVKEPAPAADGGVDTGGMQGIWAKLCGKTPNPKKPNEAVEVCGTQFEIFGKNAVPVMLGAIVKVEGEERELFSVRVPQGPKGIALRGGVVATIDKEKSIQLVYSSCFIDSCVGEAPATPELIESFKKGSTISISFFDVEGRRLTLPVSLEGFSIAYQGKGIDLKKYADLRKKYIDEVRKSEEAANPKAAEPAPANKKK